MSRFGELMALFLQETEETERSNNPIVDLLTEGTMNDEDGGGGGGGGGRLRRRRSLQQRLGLKSIVCCGSTWSFGASAITTQAHNDDEIQNDVVVGSSSHQQIDVMIAGDLTPPEITSDPDCTFPSPRMNLAAALAAERQFRSASGDVDPPETVAGGSTETVKVSLMRLLEEGEMDGQDEEMRGVGTAEMCCVCMGRKKGAALIPCGHTFCRVCCRELWLNRGSCPLCNRSILEILDIY